MSVGDGVLNDKNDNLILQEQSIFSSKNVADKVFGNLITEKKYEEMSNCAIFSAWNIDKDEIDKQVTNLLDITT